VSYIDLQGVLHDRTLELALAHSGSIRFSAYSPFSGPCLPQGALGQWLQPWTFQFSWSSESHQARFVTTGSDCKITGLILKNQIYRYGLVTSMVTFRLPAFWLNTGCGRETEDYKHSNTIYLNTVFESIFNIIARLSAAICIRISTSLPLLEPKYSVWIVILYSPVSLPHLYIRISSVTPGNIAGSYFSEVLSELSLHYFECPYVIHFVSETPN
jgi:hypothetical protein